MNIQIFGKDKCFDTKKAVRYFKERGIKHQYINISERQMSRGEFTSVKAAVCGNGGCESLIDEKCKNTDLLTLVKYLTEDAREEKIFENQILIKTPVVRNGKKATVGYMPDVWSEWE